MVQSNYNTVVQTNYAPGIRAGTPGMISHETSSDTSTWLAGSSAIPFGLAVSAVPGSAKQCALGGTAFIGITIVDITQDKMPINPLTGTEVVGDAYQAQSNVAVCTRGRIWVQAQADVAANDPVYYEGTGGTLSNNASGTAASGAVNYTQNPASGDTIVLNGTSIAWEATNPTGEQVLIGETLGESLNNLANFINTNAAADVQVAKFEAEAYPVTVGSNYGANQLLLGARTVGTGGNALTVTTTTAGATVTAMAGGVASATLISGARWLDTQVAGGLARISLPTQV